MINTLSVLNTVSLLSIIFSILIIIPHLKHVLRKSYKIIFLLILVIYLYNNLSNFLQWTGFSLALDPFEDYLLLILPILWIFFIYAYLKNIDQVKIKASEKKYSVMVNQIHDGIYIQKGEKIVFVNQKVCDELGYDKKELYEMKIWQLVHPDDRKRLQKINRNRLKGNNAEHTYEAKLLTKKGEVINCEFAVTVIEYEGELATMGSVRNITDRKKINKKLRKTLKELANSKKDMEQFLYATSHDLRTPVINIIGFNRELESSLQRLQEILDHTELPQKTNDLIKNIISDDINESLNYIVNSTKKIDTLLTGLLTISRLGREPMRIQKVDLNKVLKRVTEDFEYKIQKENIEVKISELPSCKADRSQMNQLFSNLMSNSIKNLSSERKGFIKVWGEKKDEMNIYYFEDNGIGIKEKDQINILKLFHKVNPNEPGEGLGLTIVQRIIKNHKGDICLKSTFNKGTKFVISLPRCL